MCTHHVCFRVSLLTWGGLRDEIIHPAYSLIPVWQQEGRGRWAEVRMLMPQTTDSQLLLANDQFSSLTCFVV